MRKAIKRKNEGILGWLRKTGIVLLLTLVTALFMDTNKVQAAITELTVPTVSNATTTPATVNVTIATSASGKRMLVAGVSIATSNAVAPTVNCTWGGNALTAVPNTSTSGVSTYQHTYLFYMLDNPTLMNGTARALTFTVSAGTLTANSIHHAVYDGVAQVAPEGGFSNGGSATTTISLNPPLNIATGDTGFNVAMIVRWNSTTARTLTAATNWTSRTTSTAVTTNPPGATNKYCFTSTTADSAAIASHTPSGTGTYHSSSGMVLKMADSTPPAAVNNLTVTPSGGTYTSTSPTITASITEPDPGSSVSCEYTTNGSTWAAGVVTGSTPTFTCTATPTGLSGSLTINMRATSTGGGPTTGTQIARTVDAAGPSTVTLTPSPGYTNNALYWTAATDALSGTKNYNVRFQATTPPTCSTGTSLYTGANLNYVHTGLTANTTYGYVVCANDNVGNQTQAATAAVTTTTRASVVNNCGSCHVYLGTQNPVADGTARNTPDGKFLGSHATHAGDSAGQYAYVCAKCHVAPSNNLSHMNRNLEMSNPINGDTGAKYGKGTSWPVTNSPSQFQNCSATYCHSNGTSVATGTIYTNISSPRWNTAITTCNKCHGTSTRTAGGPWYPNYNNYSTGTPLNTGWTTPGNALHEDGATATYTAATQQPLVLSSLKISQSALPAGKTITGISVAVKGKSATSRMLNVAMTKTGNATAVGTAKTVALTPTNEWHVVNTVVNDLWGTTWATTDILGAANTTFGVILKDNAATTSDINIDAIRVVVHTADAPKFNSHSAHIAKSYGCNKCHYATTTNGTSITDTSIHSVGSYSVVAGSGASFTFDNTAVGEPKCSNVSCHGPAVWGLNKFDCVSCHSVSITRTIGAAAGLTLSAVSTEFGLAWGHKKSGRGTVTAADCIVCHLEGNGTTKTASATYHQNGTIDLRDPAGTGEAIIKDFNNANFAFRRFSTNATRTSAQNSADIAQVVSLKFCIICHKKEGATNTTARANGGTANSPWGASTGYAANTNIGVTVANGTINVFSQFSSGNSSVHPVRGPRLKDFPISTRLNAPYQPTTLPGTRVAAGGTKANSIMLNCFDCHNVSGASPLRFRTVAAHGNAETIRGTVYANPSTLCSVCHAGYTVADQHGSGSAMAMSTGRTGEGFNGGCYSCHGDSGDTDGAVAPTTTRPARAAGYHGFNALVTGGNWPGLAGARPFAFIRNTVTYAGATAYHRPLSGTGLAAGAATCMGGAGCAGNGGAEPYTPGGQY